MNFIDNIIQALRSLRANVVRSTLTLFIIALGLAALIGILTAIDVTIFSLTDNFSRIGGNSIVIKPTGTGFNRSDEKKGPNIRFLQAYQLQKELDKNNYVSISLLANSRGTVKYKDQKTNPNVRVIGVDKHYATLQKFELEQGRNFSVQETTNGAWNAVVGADIVKKLFDGISEKAINKLINVDNHKFRIIGVLKSKGNTIGRSQDNLVWVPLSNAKSVFATSNSNYDVSLAPKDINSDLAELENKTIGVFRNIRGLRIGQSNDFKIVKDAGMEGLLRDNTIALRMAALAIGFLTLISASIGLMNIMMVTVTERTKEIGVSKALGATKKNILIQFLTEAVCICQLGGLLGILGGILIGNIVVLLIGGNFLMPWLWATIGFIICFFVGIISGLYPAMKAARMDPIESLRHE